MTTLDIELESVHETEVPCQKLIKDRINKGVGGDTVLTKTQLTRRRQRLVRTAYEETELECNRTLESDSLF